MNASEHTENWFWELVLKCAAVALDPLTCFLFEIGATGTEEVALSASQATIKVFFNSDKQDPAGAVQSIAENLMLSDTLEIISLKKHKVENWQANWQAHFKPLAIGKSFCVRPPWSIARQDKKQIVIQPGFGFGTGYHESTHLALQLLEQVAAIHPFESVLDVGTGSGILAIGALLLGARMVHAIDIDSDAINEVQINLKLSGLDSKLCSVECGDVVHLNRPPSDLLLANIEDHILIGLASDLVRLTKPGGMLLLSGILTDRKQHVIKKLGEHVRLVSQKQMNEWTGVILERIE